MKLEKDNLYGYLFTLPFVIIFLFFLVYPFGKLFYISFFEWNLMAVAIDSSRKTFVGFENFYYLLAGEGVYFDLTIFFTPIKIITFFLLTSFLIYCYSKEI